MSYIDRIDAIAQRAASRSESEPLDVRIANLWKKLELMSAAINYDIFTPSVEIRLTMQNLTSVLYEIQGASPGADTEQLREKNKLYGGSWCKRGGPGAFMMLARKADRFLETPNGDHEDTLGDLRRYLILVEAWLQEKEQPKEQPTPIEEVGATIEEAFSKSLCSICSHHRDTHEPRDDLHPKSFQLVCRATGCLCSGFSSK